MKAGDRSEKYAIEEVIINQIEYMDGRRPGWNPKTFSAEALEKVAGGKWAGL